MPPRFTHNTGPKSKITEVYSEPHQTSKIERFTKKVNCFYLLITSEKDFVLDVSPVLNKPIFLLA